MPEVSGFVRLNCMASSVFDLAAAVHSVESDGFVLLKNGLPPQRCAAIRHCLTRAEAESNSSSLRRRNGTVYAIRHLLDLCPEIETLWSTPELIRFLMTILGSACGLVRALLFDKPPNQTWAVPWHQDRTIAIAPPSTPSAKFSSSRLKSGVWHAELPMEVLERMLTLRIHLDAVTDENGPLEVSPGTHRDRELRIPNPGESVRILAAEGDILAMRPLLAHASPRSQPDARCHRRVLHLEFAADPELPDGYRWHRFMAVADSALR
jgi:hypothetical protein